jgi:AraC-like DNA-binding protein
MIHLRGTLSVSLGLSASAAEPLLQPPDPSRRILAAVETPAVKVEETEYARGLCIARHSHDTSNFIYIIAGAHWSGHGRGGDLCPPRTVRFLPAGEPHENYFPKGSRCLHVELRTSIERLAGEYGARLSASGELKRPSAALLGARLYHEFLQRDSVSPLGIEEVILELLLAGSRETPQRRSAVPPWLIRIRDMLQEHETSRPTLAEFSRCAGRHPVQISRQFHRHFACTLSEYVRRVRIARAQSLLASPDWSLSDIALVCGFSDQSHFTSVFRRLSGMSPRRYRLRYSRQPASEGVGKPA